MRIVAYKFIGDELVIISIISEYGIERKYSARVGSLRLQRLANAVMSYNTVFTDLPNYDLAVGVE